MQQMMIPEVYDDEQDEIEREILECNLIKVEQAVYETLSEMQL